MKKMLVSCVLLFLNGFAVARNVVVGRHYVSRYLDPIIPFTLAEPAPERRDLQQDHMPEQVASAARVTRTERDQRPALRMFTLPRNDFAH
ncbi:hypothetical protein ACFOPQ_09495 [Deinococcus antarcticus]|uniref:Secreted protein n=1 Tax=Deinococcus antarcticus TaxID=1298767 RepID=A0ABV8A984_9DEIO